MDLEEIGINAGNWADAAQDMDYCRSVLNAALNEPPGSIRHEVSVLLSSLFIYRHFLHPCGAMVRYRDLKEIRLNTRNLVDSAQDKDCWKSLVNAVLNLRVQKGMLNKQTCKQNTFYFILFNTSVICLHVGYLIFLNNYLPVFYLFGKIIVIYNSIFSRTYLMNFLYNI